MARLRVSETFLAEMLFPGAAVEIIGASYNESSRHAVLDVLGASVPDAEEVMATVSVDSKGKRTTTFEPVR